MAAEVLVEDASTKYSGNNDMTEAIIKKMYSGKFLKPLRKPRFLVTLVTHFRLYCGEHCND